MSKTAKLNVRKEETHFMQRWNEMVLLEHPHVVQDKQVFELASKFVPLIEGDETCKSCFKQHVLVLWDHGLLTKVQARELIEAAV